MPIPFKLLRPAGNPVKLQKTALNRNQFLPFEIDFYHSGTAALAAAILASIKFKSGSIDQPEVIVPAYGCPDLISAILYAGATPVLVDLEPNSPRMALTQIEQAISTNTTALLAVRFLGIPERMDKLTRICRQHNILMIEDSAQGFPITEPSTYWSGDYTILSFGRGKPVNLLSGGAVLTKQHELRILLTNPTPPDESFISKAKNYTKIQTYNILINPVAYALISILPGLNIGSSIYKPLHSLIGMPEYAKARLNTNIEFYRKSLNIGLLFKEIIRELNTPDIIDIAVAANFDYANPLLRYPLLIKNQETRDLLYRVLLPFGASKMYRRPLFEIEGIPNVFSHSSIKSLPNSAGFADRLLTLPTHQSVTKIELAEIKKELTEVLHAN